MIKHKQHILNAHYTSILLLLLGFIGCNKQVKNEPVFIHKVYNDTFKINVIHGPAPEFQDTTKIDTLYFDLNNDGHYDLTSIYSRIVNLSETALRFGSVNNDYFAYDSSLLNFKSFRKDDTISINNFSNQIILPYQIFNSNPSGLIIKVDLNGVDSRSGIFYLAMMNNSFSNNLTHHFTWLKLQLYQNSTTNYLGLILLESGYNVTPLSTIKIGEY